MSTSAESAGPNAEMSAFWNGDAAKRWIDHDDRYEAQLAPLTAHVLSRARLRATDTVLDVGCGTGTLAIASRRKLGSTGSVMGVDISSRMLKRARVRLAETGLNRVAFFEGDAQVSTLGTGAYDRIISRLGVMFFDDPEAAFANLVRGAKPDARLAFVCWQTRAENPWVSTALSIISEHVEMELPPEAVPGPWSMADPATTTRTLNDSGWRDVTATPIHGSLHVGGPGTVREAVDFVSSTGQIVMALDGAKKKQRRRALDAITESFEAHHDGTGVAFPYAIWLVDARR